MKILVLDGSPMFNALEAADVTGPRLALVRQAGRAIRRGGGNQRGAAG